MVKLYPQLHTSSWCLIRQGDNFTYVLEDRLGCSSLSELTVHFFPEEGRESYLPEEFLCSWIITNAPNHFSAMFNMWIILIYDIHSIIGLIYETYQCTCTKFISTASSSHYYYNIATSFANHLLLTVNGSTVFMCNMSFHKTFKSFITSHYIF